MRVWSSLQDAYAVFLKITKRTAYTWNAIISGHVSHNESEIALTLYSQMQISGVRPNEFIFSSVLKACTSLGFLYQGQIVHDQMLRHGVKIDLASGNALLDMYTKLWGMPAAQKVFTGLSDKDVVSWTTMISGFVQHGLPITALNWYVNMQVMGFLPNRITFLCTIKACGAATLLQGGQIIHDHIVRNSFDATITMKNMLIDFYSKCNSLKEAQALFDALQMQDAVSWGALMSGYAQHGNEHLVFESFGKILNKGVQPNEYIFVCVLKVASKLAAWRQGQEIHALLLKEKLESDTEIGNALIDMYSKCGCLDEAYTVLIQLKSKDEISWGAIISGYTQQGGGARAIELFGRSQVEGFTPNTFILSCVLKACGISKDIIAGSLVHLMVISNSLEVDIAVGNALIDMYAKCGSILEAREVFDKLPFQDMIAWGAMIAGYVQNGFAALAIGLVEEMQQKGRPVNEIIISSIVKGCGNMKAASEGRHFHDLIMRAGYDSNLVILNTLIAMYVQCQYLLEAQRMFDLLPTRDDVSWGTIVIGYAENSLHLQALSLFGRMIKEGFKANRVVILGCLKACVNTGALKKARLLHNYMVQFAHDSDEVLSSTLIDTYAKCGSLQDSCTVFDGMNVQDGITWGIISAACAHHNEWKLSMYYYKCLQQKSSEMTTVFGSSMLSAFSHVGYVREAQDLFHSFGDKNPLSHCSDHNNCMVYILGRTGLLAEAKFVLATMPILPDGIGHVSLLAACKTHGDMELGSICAGSVSPALAPLSSNGSSSSIFEAKLSACSNSSYRDRPPCMLHHNALPAYAQISSTYTEFKFWSELSRVQALRSFLSVWNPSLIDDNNTSYTFCVGDHTGLSYGAVNLMQKRLLRLLKLKGFDADLETSALLVCKTDDIELPPYIPIFPLYSKISFFLDSCVLFVEPYIYFSAQLHVAGDIGHWKVGIQKCRVVRPFFFFWGVCVWGEGGSLYTCLCANIITSGCEFG
ncbi:hypothetical protein KP509_01G107500 [Ceratopteris richardii]|uniref:Pentatricopeptide repeat-containing protein n=1 Tax=Ceratopteris richardii TaxID=49495 RepID=A0A8T2VG18_CERRI|nr:hypothetical protein KP509_01G107500 [Ceratopteris richardii]